VGLAGDRLFEPADGLYVRVRAFDARSHGVHRQVGGSGFVPSGGGLVPSVFVAISEIDASLYSDGGRVSSSFYSVLTHLGYLVLSFAIRLKLGKPTIAQLADAANYAVGSATNQMGMVC